MEWEQWRQQPETQALLKYLARQRERIKENWAAGEYVSDTMTTETGKNAEALGRTMQLGDVIYKIVDEPESMEVVDE